MNAGLVERVLSYAIHEEVRAFELYLLAASKVEDRVLKTMLNDLAVMEKSHEEKLRSLGKSGNIVLNSQKVEDLKISDFLVEKELPQSQTVQEIMIYAMKSEKRAHDLYHSLADASPDSEIRGIFEALAQEELSHKRALEESYDDTVYRGN